MNEAIEPGVNFKAKRAKHLLALLPNALNISLRQVNRRDFAGQAGQVLRAVVEQLVALYNFGGRQGQGLAVFVFDYDAGKFAASNELLYQDLGFAGQASQHNSPNLSVRKGGLQKIK